MKYFVDCEFDGFGGNLLSLAICREDGEILYLVYKFSGRYKDQWVVKNVVPILRSVPKGCKINDVGDVKSGARLIHQFMKNDSNPVIIFDWPDDIKYFCQAIMTGPGEMVGLDNLTFKMFRVDAYPTELKDAVQHNAAWDALALSKLF